MLLTCTSRILNTSNPIEATAIPMVITDEDMDHASVIELDHQARLAYIYERLAEFAPEIEEISEAHYRLYFTASELRHLNREDTIFMANANAIAWLRIEVISVPEEPSHPKYYRVSLRNEDVDN